MNESENIKIKIKALYDLVANALNDIYESSNEKDLITRKVNERSIAFRFGLNFNDRIKATEFKEYDVDVEYNRDMSDPKKIPDDIIEKCNEVINNCPKMDYDVREACYKINMLCTYPDVILHRRKKYGPQNSLIVIEFKGHWNSNETARILDRKKLKIYTTPKNKFCCKYQNNLSDHSKEKCKYETQCSINRSEIDSKCKFKYEYCLGLLVTLGKIKPTYEYFIGGEMYGKDEFDNYIDSKTSNAS